MPVLSDEDLAEDPPGHKSGYVAIIGKPNAGGRARLAGWCCWLAGGLCLRADAGVAAGRPLLREQAAPVPGPLLAAAVAPGPRLTAAVAPGPLLPRLLPPPLLPLLQASRR